MAKKRAFRIGVFDFEMTNLSADFGFVLCGVVKDYHDRRPTVFRVDDVLTGSAYQCDCGRTHWDDLPVALRLRDELEGYDILISYNGKEFDIPFLNMRLLAEGERALRAPLKHVDLYKDLARRREFRLHTGKLDTLAKHLRLPVQKTPLDPPLWVAAAAGCSKSLDLIVEHCVHDVLVLEQAFDRTKDLLGGRWW